MIEIIKQIDLKVTEEEWVFAEERRTEIAAHWAELIAEKPALWDGRVLGTLEPQVARGVFSARLFETSFSAFLAWRDWGFPDKTYFNLFGSAVITGSDGGIIFAVMGDHTSNAGAIYPCGGSLEPADVGADGGIDLDGSIARELFEETGLQAGDARLGQGFLVRTGQLLSFNRVLHFEAPTEDLAAQIENNIAAQTEPELACIVVLRRFSDVNLERSEPYAVVTARYLLGA